MTHEKFNNTLEKVVNAAIWRHLATFVEEAIETYIITFINTNISNSLEKFSIMTQLHFLHLPGSTV